MMDYNGHQHEPSLDSMGMSVSLDDHHQVSYSSIFQNEKGQRLKVASAVETTTVSGSFDNRPPSLIPASSSEEWEEWADFSGDTSFASFGSKGTDLKPSKPASYNSTRTAEERHKDMQYREKRRQREVLQASVSSASSESSDTVGPLPGAYVVNRSGSAMRRSTTVDQDDATVGSKSTLDRGFNHALHLPQATPITAELAHDSAAELERRLRLEILQEAAPASIVPSCVPSLLTTSSGYSSHSLPVDLDKNFYRPRGVKEKIFGDARKGDFGFEDIAAAPDRCIRKRQYLPFQVKGNFSSRSKSNQQWRVTIQTDQDAVESNHLLKLERGERHYSAASEHEAHELAEAIAVPRMDPLDENPICFLCKTKFAVFRPARHCCNCGVVVCAKCSCQWPAKMLPDTYGVKMDAVGNVCMACDWSAREFKVACLQGNTRRAVELYRNGNVNLRTQSCLDKKGEAMHPVHMAILGGSIELLRWLANRRCCPMEDPSQPQGRLLTSRGRSPLALAFGSLALLQYLVGEHGLDIRQEKSLHYETMLSHLAVLLEKPSRKSPQESSRPAQKTTHGHFHSNSMPHRDRRIPTFQPHHHHSNSFPQKSFQDRKAPASQRPTLPSVSHDGAIDFESDGESSRRGSF